MNRKHFILYDKDDLKCDSMGLAILDEYIKDDVITESLNSNYTFEFMILHEYANLLEGRSIIKAPTRQGEELFRVRMMERNTGDDGYTYVYCVQLFYCDMEDRMIEDLELNDVSGSTALTQMSQATDAPHNFTFYSNIDTVAYSYYYHKQFTTALVGDLDESFVNLWGGELEVNKWNVKMLKQRGENRGVKVQYRDNLTGLNVAHDYSPVITRLYPMSADGITLDEKYVDSPLINPNHPITQSMTFDYIYLSEDNGEDGGYLTEAEVKTAIKLMAEDMFKIGNIDKPESRYDVSLQELCRTREHSHYAVLDYIFLGDTVEVIHEDLDVNISTRLIEYTYKPTTDRYLSLTLGTVTGTFSNNTQRTQESILDKIETNKQTIQGKLDAAVEHLTSLIQGGVDGHVVITQNEILIMDTTDPATAVEVWRFNSGGIGYSNTGYNGPFIGLTKDGKLVVNEATAHSFSASLIQTGLLQSADGKSWWNFENGHFNWADTFSFDGETVKFEIDGSNLSDVLDKTFTIVASHENQVVPVTSEGKAIGYGDYLFEFTVIRNYSGTEAPCLVTKITPSSKITGVSFLQNENTCSMIIAKEADLSANPDEYFDVELTILDYVLTKRITWCTVVQGVDGNDGLPGQAYYTWIKYADDANGGGISNSPNGKSYIGFAYNKTTPTESNKASDYSWSLLKGTDGLPGKPGDDGTTYYTWIKYSDYSDGRNMYNTPDEMTGYIGIAVNQTTEVEGDDPSVYTWSKFRGDDGTPGQPGKTYYTWIKYADDDQGTGMSDYGNGKAYIGIAYNKETQTESTNASDYTWTLIKGTDGLPGKNGNNGKTYYTWIKYSDNADGTGMYDTPTNSTLYIGIAVNQTSATESTDKSKYTWSRFRGEDGEPGIPGTSYYTWIKYADDASGTGLSDSPDGKTYIGFAYNKMTATESTKAGDYTWSLIKGTDGQPGKNGNNGVTYYTWIKYSDYADGTNMYDVPTTKTMYIGIAVNQTSKTESTDKSKYTWSKFRGDDGVAGKTYYTWVKYADDANGTNMSDYGEGKSYLGLAHNKTTATESTNASDYTWTLIKGADGLPGKNGNNGTTYYTWVKYSDKSDGSNMYDTPTDKTMYIGLAFNQTSKTESTDKTKYTWSRFRGSDGNNGAPGKDGITQKHNLIKNSAFFNGSSGWRLSSDTSLDYEFKYGDHPTFHVAKSGITSQATWPGIDTTTNCTITEFKEGVTYTLSYVYYVPDVTLFDPNLSMSTPTSSALGFNVLATDADGNNTYYGTSLNISGLVQGVWTKYSTSFTPKKTCKVGRIKFGIAANGEAWATDFKLEENDQASEWCGTADESIGQDGVDGKPGNDAQTVSIVASSNVFKSTDGGVTYTPGSVTLTPLYQNVSHSKWVYSTNNGTSWTTVGSGVSGLTLNGQTVVVSYDCKLFTSSITTVQFKVISTNASVYDVITITKISERADLNNVLSTMEMSISQSNTAWQAAFKTSSANNLLKNSDAKFGTENWMTNGGGITVAYANAFPFYGYSEPYFRTTFPSGIKYSEDIFLEPNTDYVYEGYVYVNGSIVPSNRSPLHFWCYSENSGTIEACDIIDYRQNLVSGRFVKCYVHFKTKDITKVPIVFRAFVYSTSTIDLVGAKRLSLKKADRETEWCQHPNEVSTSAVTISEFGLKATHSDVGTYTVMNASGNTIYDVETNEAIAWMSAKEQWTEAKFDYVYANNIVNTYCGDYTLYVNHSHTGASLGTSDNPFSSFADLANHLPENSILTQDLFIVVRDPGFEINESLILGRISGSGYIKIKFEGQLVINGVNNHCIQLYQINNWVWIEGVRVNVSSSTTGAVLVARATSNSGNKCIYACDVSRLEVDRITMVNTSGCAIDTERTDLYTYCCDFGNSARAVWLRYQSVYFTSNDCGSCNNFVYLSSGSKAFWGHDGSPIRPSGSVTAYNGIYYSYANCSTKTSARYSGTSAPSTPSGAQNYTETFDHSSLQTYQYKYLSWTTDGTCKQGQWESYGLRGGHMFFDISAIRSFLSGTVLDGNTITLKRANSGGMNAQSNVYINGSTCTEANGKPSYSNKTHLGTLGWGEQKTFELPLAIVQSLKSGTCSSLAVYTDSSDKYDYINITSASITLKCKK